MQEKITGISPIILNAVQELGTGMHGLASFLKGLKSKNNMANKLYCNKGFGALFWVNTDGIRHIIKQLIEAGLIELYDWGEIIRYPYYIPKLRLTANGRKFIEQGLDMPLFVEPSMRELKQTDTIMTSVELFKEYKNVANVAEFRKLKPTTIWEHLEYGIKLGLIEKEEVIPAIEAEKIIEAKKENSNKRLAEIKELFPHLEWGFIRCALAKKER